jgi:hypothetical protein
MLDSNPLIQYLRKKPERTKTVLAVIGALIPTLAVGYAQFYMRARDLERPAVAENTPASDGNNDISIFAAVGKIFEEGKKTVGSSVDTLRKLDPSILDGKPIEVTSTDTPAAPSKLDVGAVPGADWSNATVTKTFDN